MTSDSGIVLMLTHSADRFTVDRVREAVARRGARAVRFDTDCFPRETRLSSRLHPDGCAYLIENLADDQGDRLPADQVRAVWARRLWKPRFAAGLDPRFEESCARESRAALMGFLDGLWRARWINDPAANEAAGNKLRQLRLAREAGLTVPRTLMTNAAGRAQEFYREMEGSVVAKLLTPFSVSVEGDAPFVHTSQVREEDLDAMESLRHAPMVFQERIPKLQELRAVWVDGEFFVGSLDASRSAAGRTDWRRAAPHECRWRRDELPASVRRPLSALILRLGLVQAAADIIRTPGGEHVLLEVNPAGEWGMLERDLGLPISEAIAAALLRPGGAAA